MPTIRYDFRWDRREHARLSSRSLPRSQSLYFTMDPWSPAAANLEGDVSYFPPERAHGRPSWPEVVDAVVRAFREQGTEVDEQATHIMEVLRARPDFPSAHYWKGVAHRQMGQTGPALAHLSRAVELEPSLVAARLELGALLLAAGRHAEAVEQYERAAALRPLDPDSQRALDRAREAQR